MDHILTLIVEQKRTRLHQESIFFYIAASYITVEFLTHTPLS